MSDDKNSIVTMWIVRIKNHPVVSIILICITLITTIASLVGAIEDFKSWILGGKAETYEALIFSTSDGIEVTKSIAKKIQEAKPGDIFYISVDEFNHGGPTCAGSPECDTWELHLRKCNLLNYEGGDLHEEGIDWTPEVEDIFGVDPQCIPALLLPTKMDTGKNNVMDCSPNGYTLSGFFTVHYLRGHFGQLFYRADIAIPSPDRVNATLAAYGTNTCWPE